VRVRVAMATERIATEVVGEDEQHVGPAHGSNGHVLLGAQRTAQQQEQRCRARNEAAHGSSHAHLALR